MKLFLALMCLSLVSCNINSNKEVNDTFSCKKVLKIGACTALGNCAVQFVDKSIAIAYLPIGGAEMCAMSVGPASVKSKYYHYNESDMDFFKRNIKQEKVSDK